MAGSFTSFGSGIRRSLSSFSSFAVSVSRASLNVAQDVGVLAKAGLDIASSFEDAFTDVTKTVEGLAELDSEGFVRLTESGEELKQAIIDISNETPVLFEELAKIAGLGGQLGLAEGLDPEGTQRVLGQFSQTIAGLAEATDLTQRRAAIDLAQITSIFRNTADSTIESADDIIDNIDNLGNTLVELGNTSATTEGRILSFAQRISGTAQTVGIAQEDMLGISAGFTSLGLTAEAGGSSVIRTLIAMQKAISSTGESFLNNSLAIGTTIEKINVLEGQLETIRAKTGVTTEEVMAQRDAWIAAGNAAEDFGSQLGATERRQVFRIGNQVEALKAKLDALVSSDGLAIVGEDLQKFADVLGISGDAFQALFKEDPTEAFLQFLEGLDRAGEDAGQTLQDLSLGTVQTLRALLNASSASSLLRDRVEAANKAWEEGTALTDEVAIRYATLTSRAQRLNNRFRNTVSILFDDFIPVVGAAVDILGEFILLAGSNIPPITAGINIEITQSLPDILKELDRIVEPIEGLINQLPTFTFDPVGAVREGLESLTTFLEGIDLTQEAEVFQGIMDVFKSDEGFTGFINTIAPELIRLLGEISTTASNITLEIDAFKTSLSIRFETFDFQAFANDTFGILADALNFVNENWESFKQGFLGISAAISGAGVITTITAVGVAIAGLISPMNFLIGIGAGLGVAWRSNWLGIQEIVSSATDTIIGKFNSIKEVFDAGFGEIEFDSLAPIEDHVSNISEIFAGFEFTLPLEFTLFLEALEPLGEQISNVGKSFGNLGTSIGTFISAITAPTVGFTEAVSPFKEFLIEIGAINVAGFDSLIRFMTDLINLSAEWVRTAKDIVETDPGKVLANSFEPLEDIEVTRLTNLGTAMEQAKPSIFGFLNSLLGLGELTINLDFLQSLKDLGDTFAAIINIGKPLAEVGVEIGKFLGIFSEDVVVGEISGLRDLVSIFAEFSTAGIKEVAREIVEFKIAILFFTEGFTGIAEILRRGPAEDFKNQALEFGLGMKIFTSVFGEGIEQIGLWNEATEEPIEGPSFGTLFSEGITQIKEWSTALAEAISAVNETEVDTTILRQSIVGVFDNIFADVNIGFPNVDSLVEFLFTAPGQIKETFTGILSDVSLFGDLVEGIPIPDFTSIKQSIVDQFEGSILGTVDWGWPVWQDVEDFFIEIRDGIIETFQNVFTNITVLGNADVGITLGDLFGGINGEEEGDEIARAVTQGLTIGIVTREPEAEEAGMSFAESFVSGFKEFFDIESPSSLMQSFGKDITDGLILGITNIGELNTLADGIRLTFQGMFASITEDMTLFATDTVPRVVSVLQDDLIPTKQLLAEVIITEVIPSISELTIAEELLGDVFERTTGLIENQIEWLIEFKDEAKKLVPEVDKLAKAFEELAKAINKVESPSIVVPGTPPAADQGQQSVPFQKGGSFIVPTRIPPQLRGNTGGMLLEVHPNERVDITPSNIVRQLRQIPEALRNAAKQVPLQMPSTSGAQISNQISNDNSQSSTDLHLHIQEVPSSNVRDSFDLLRSVAGA